MAQTAIISPQILDSTQIGRDLITAADQAAVQAIVGAGVDLTADYTWTGSHTFTSPVQVEATTFDQNIHGVSGDADRAYIGTTAYSDPTTKQTNAVTLLKFDGEYAGADWSTWRIGLESAYEMYFGVSAFAVRYNGSFRFGLVDFGDGEGAGLVAQNATLGLAGYRWPKSWLEEVNVNDTLNLEVGGSLKLYNLGDYGDADTEYLEVAVDSNRFSICPKTTGVGVKRELILGTATDNITIKWHGTLIPYDSGSNISMSGSMVEFGSKSGFRHNSNSAVDAGGCLEIAERFSSGVARQWWAYDGSIHYFGDGFDAPCDVKFNITNTNAGDTDYERVRFNYSGTVAQLFSEAGGTGTSREFRIGTYGGYQVMLGTASQGSGLGFNGVKTVYWTPSALRPFGAGKDLGARSPSTDSWALVGAVDGSFSGNLDAEVGGSMRLFNLGSDGDTDTEYLEIEGDAANGYYRIQPKYTGSGRSVQTLRLLAIQGSHISLYGGGQFAYTHAGVQHLYCSGDGVRVTDLEVTGDVVAATFTGDGSGLTNLPSSGTSNPFDQDLNTTDSVTFDQVDMSKQIINLYGVEGDADRSYFETNLYNGGGTDIATFFWNTTGSKLVSGTAFKIGYAQGWNMHFQDDAFVFQQQGSFRMGIYQDAFVSSYMPLGSEIFHWSAGWFDDLKVFDDLINEDGSDRLHYGLGEVGDADTEYVRQFWDGNTYKIKNYKTGNGSLRSMSLESNDGTGVLVTPYDIRLRRAGIDRILMDSTTLRPSTNNFMNNGTDAYRWKSTNSYITSTATKMIGEVGCVFKQFAEGDDTSTNSSYYQTTFVAGNMYIGTKTAGNSTAADIYIQRDSVNKLAVLDEGVRLYNVLTVPSTTSGVIYKDANGFLKLS